MKYIFLLFILFTVVGCKYEVPKATYSIIEVDTIAIDQQVLHQSVNTSVVSE